MQNVGDVIRAQAVWREGKAAEYPDDVRNAESAAALRRLAEHVECIPDEPWVRFLSAQIQVDGGFGQGATRELSRFGFGDRWSKLVSPNRFLLELCVFAAVDALELIAEGVLSWTEAVERYRLYFRDARQMTIEPLYPSELAEYADPDFLTRLCLRDQDAVAA